MTQGSQTRDAASAATRTPRRTQAERSAETRRILLETMIACLHARGDAATTTLLVAELAGLSWGAMLHQFPTRVDLMMFVAQSVFDDEVAIYDARLAAIPDFKARLYAFPQIVWDVLSRPSGAASGGDRAEHPGAAGALVRGCGQHIQNRHAPDALGNARLVHCSGAGSRSRGDREVRDSAAPPARGPCRAATRQGLAGVSKGREECPGSGQEPGSGCEGRL